MRSSLYLRGKIWHANLKLDSWTSEVRFSLETSDRRCAEAKLSARIKDAEYEDAGLRPPLSVREGLQQPLESLCAAFLSDIRDAKRSENTLRIYNGALNKLRLGCGWKLLRDVSEKSFCEWRRDCGLRAKTINCYHGAWLRFLRWLKRRRMLLENPLEYVGPVDASSESREYRRALTPAEVARLLSSSRHPRCVVYRLLLETGLRRREVNGLRWSDFWFNAPPGAEAGVTVDRQGEAPPVVRSLESKGEGAEHPACEGHSPQNPPVAMPAGTVRVPASLSKNHKADLFPLSACLVAEILALRKPDTPSFQLVFKGSVPEVYTMRRDLTRAGIAFKDDMGRRVDLHALRKTFGTALVLSGAAPRTVMRAMRHSDLKLTMVTYMDAGQIPLNESFGKLPWAGPDAQPRTG